MGEFTHEGPKRQPTQLKAEGGVSMAPPAFGLGASPVQRQVPGDGNTGTTTNSGGTTTAAPELAEGPLQAFDGPAAITYNNGKEFRIDWVRNLQLSLMGSRISTDGSFDQATVDAVARFQMTHLPDSTPDGKIGPNTRRKLEEVYPVLLSTIVGGHTASRILVPAGAGNDERFSYWRGIVEAAGGVFNDTAMALNLVGIRGVLISDGSATHTVNGAIVPAGAIYQSSSAQQFLDDRTAGVDNTHMSGRHTGFNDLMVSLWIDAEGVMHVQERIGNVDPNEVNDSDQYGTGHLMDGQYAYELGTHGTKSRSHRDAVNGIEDPDNDLGRRTVDGKLRYAALRPTRNQEVWREHESNDFSISENEETTSRERIYNRNSRYVNDDFAMNIHSSSNDHPNSQACMNVPADQYLDFIHEVQGSSNQRNILYTLIDASKIENGLVLQTQQQQTK
jgi:hypothetical protein